MSDTIEIVDLAEDELKAIRAFDRHRIVDEIEQQLTHQPNVETRNRKPLDSAAPGFEHVPPLWEPRVGDFRVFLTLTKRARWSLFVPSASKAN